MHTDDLRRSSHLGNQQAKKLQVLFIGLGGLNSRRSFWHITWKDRVKSEFRSEKENPKKSIWNMLKSSYLHIVGCKRVESGAYMPKAGAQWRPRFSH